MTDYSNNREWKLVEPDGGEFYFDNSFTVEEVIEILGGLIEQARSEGLEGCQLYFQSNHEPYEDYLSDPSVVVRGYRKLNYKEVKEFEKEDALRALSKSLGISPYEASVVQKLQASGKLPKSEGCTAL